MAPVRRTVPALILGLAAAAAAAAAAVLLWGPKDDPKTPERTPVAPLDLPPVARPNFVIVDIDTFSADRVGALRDGVEVTPTITRLASGGATFTQAFSPSGWTMPALTSMLIGRYPVPLAIDGTTVTWRPSGSRDIAEILGYYGYTTAAFWADTLPGPMGTVAAASFHHVSRGPGGGGHQKQASALGWLERQPEEPFFAYIHEVDLHAPDPLHLDQTGMRFTAQERSLNATSYHEIFQQLAPHIGERAAVERTKAIYDGTINLYDRKLAEIRRALRKTGAAERTVLIITSDHGEDMFEHAYGDHGLLYDTVLRVPLVWVDPNLPERGQVIDTVVQGIDLAPSVLARAGIPVDAGMEGQSLLPLMGLAEGNYEERPVHSMTDACNLSLRAEGWKLILRDRTPPVDRAWLAAYRNGQGADGVELASFLSERGITDLPLPDCLSEREIFARVGLDHVAVQPTGGVVPGAGSDASLLELYDLSADPLEHHDLARANPDRVEVMLRELLEAAAARRDAAGMAYGEPLTAEQEQALKDQGYWGFVTGRAEPGPPPPRDGQPPPPPPNRPPPHR